MQYSINDFRLLGYMSEKLEDGSYLIATRDFLHQEKEPAFSKFLDSITGGVLSKSPELIKPSQIDNLLVVVDKDNRATVIINELEIIISGYTKKAVEAGDQITVNDIAHIRKAEIKNHLQANEKFIFIFNIGWLRGACFDLTPRDDKYNGLSIEELTTWFGQSISYLSFKSRFSFTDKSWEFFLRNDFFPFIYLKADDINIFKNMAEIEAENFDDVFVSTLAEVFDSELQALSEKWQKNLTLKLEESFITTAVNRYLANDYISCISVLHPRIEKMLRLHLSRNTSEPTNVRKTYDQKNLSKSVQVNFDKDVFPFTPLLAERFAEYLEKSFFKNFTPGSFDEKLGRHSVCHGVVSETFFNKKFSIISFLIIDQLYYSLSADERLCNIRLL